MRASRHSIGRVVCAVIVLMTKTPIEVDAGRSKLVREIGYEHIYIAPTKHIQLDELVNTT